MIMVQIRPNDQFPKGSDSSSALCSGLRGTLPSNMTIPSNDAGASKTKSIHDQELWFPVSQYPVDWRNKSRIKAQYLYIMNYM